MVIEPECQCSSTRPVTSQMSNSLSGDSAGGYLSFATALRTIELGLPTPAGLIGLTKSLTVIGSPHGIRACCVSPGPVLTRPEMARMKTRLGRAAETHEVADLILYLSSDQAAFITGANYVIDGGRSCGGI